MPVDDHFSITGLSWRSAPGGGVHVADIQPGAAWTARTAQGSTPPGAAPEDGAAKLLAAAAADPARRIATRLVVSVSRGAGGFGPLSTRGAEAFAAESVRALKTAPSNLLHAAAGPAGPDLPVGELLRALGAAQLEPARCAPEGPHADAVGLPFRTLQGPVEVGAACLRAVRFGAQVWIAATAAAVPQRVLEDWADRLWTAGPLVERAGTGFAPGDALLIFATGASGAPVVEAPDAPEGEAVAVGLAAALSLLARRRLEHFGACAALMIRGAGSWSELERAAQRLVPLLSLEKPRLAAIEDLRDRLWAGLLTADVPGLERTPVRATLEERLIIDGMKPLKAAEDDEVALEAWLRGAGTLELDLGRGRACGTFRL